MVGCGGGGGSGVTCGSECEVVAAAAAEGGSGLMVIAVAAVMEADDSTDAEVLRVCCDGSAIITGIDGMCINADDEFNDDKTVRVDDEVDEEEDDSCG